ncbi:hypothetical protein C1Y40_04480 [Mycobacterium talmoniae]|uniref:Uncharacterized protein n=1 Tax=Mycobacterium talmoniae TaxID=1858794 RepID=A0A2S8BFB9_9MYCO|nr:hypothetical protein C1Y40_04480 [Mycobacterium talmoniae]
MIRRAGMMEFDPNIPPMTGEASSTVTLRPALAKYAAAVNPLWPAPMTMTSRDILLFMRIPYF